jgi:hypothetical protein
MQLNPPQLTTYITAKLILIGLLLITILFIRHPPSTEACSNQSCSGGGVCSGSADNNCLWKSRSDGGVYCVTISCPSGGLGGDGGSEN